YDPALISPTGVYALQAQVAVGDQVLLATAVPMTVLINALAVTGDLLVTTPAAPVAPPVQVTPIVPAPPIVQPPAPTVGIQSASVSGNVQLNPAELLPQGAQLVIQLVDLASASVLASSTVEASGQAGPFAYQLIYDPTLIVQTETYGVQAQVLANGATLYVSPQPALVITNGNPLQADVVINRVG
ncbi:MAG: YbaY family lipoprotein, partial [Anaerolineae bacterium]|nr:YbaY family lipoprotein [Anaerolineae bacterium]